MIPNRPTGRASAEVLRVFRALKRIPGNDFECRYDMSLTARAQPEFLILYQQAHVFLMSVSTLSRDEVEGVLQGSLFSKESALDIESFGLQTTSTMESFWELILEAEGVEPSALAPIQRIVLFPNVAQAILDKIQQMRPLSGYQLWGGETLRGEGLHDALVGVAKGKADVWTLEAMRKLFDPQIVVPATFTPNRGSVRDVNASLTEGLLDADQEATSKLDLELSEDADTATRQYACRLVTGVAGSGKTLVLLYRAMYCARLAPGSRILLLTHNRPLNLELQSRVKQLYPDSRFDQMTFLQWCRQQFGHFTIIKPYDRRKLLGNLIEGRAAFKGLSVDFIQDELDWLMDNAITQREEYLASKRTGRGRQLGERQREAVFAVFAEYCRTLNAQGLDDWAGVPLKLMRGLQRGELTLPVYDFIFIDEAQFFAPVWFEVIKAALAPRGQLFLAADPTQGFLKRRQSWKTSGLDVVGRSTRLNRPYRNTREIMRFATRFYVSRLADDDEPELNLLSEDQINSLPDGAEPEVLEVGSAQDEISRLLNEVDAYLKEGGNPGNVLVIHCNSSLTLSVIDRLNQRQSTPNNPDGDIALEAGKSYDRNNIRVTSANATTGLEAPIVFILGVKGLLEPEQDFNLTDAEREELCRENTRRLYVAMTRATVRLIIFGNLAIPGAEAQTEKLS